MSGTVSAGKAEKRCQEPFPQETVPDTFFLLEIVTSLLEPKKTLKIAKADVLRRQASPVSAMPSGLLNFFSENEIVDLLAYLLANRKSPK